MQILAYICKRNETNRIDTEQIGSCSEWQVCIMHVKRSPDVRCLSNAGLL